MSKHRMRFSKTGVARYISHLDLMRTLQRAIQRSGVGVKHTEGFNPHSAVSVLLPLSLGYESECELMDFEVTGGTPLEEVPARINAMLPQGIHVQSVYEGGAKVKLLRFVRCQATLVYDTGVTTGISNEITELFFRDSLIITKKSKRGEAELDMIPCMHKYCYDQVSETELNITATLTAQDPALSPEYIVRAIERYRPDLAPDFARFRRLEVYDAELEPFK